MTQLEVRAGTHVKAEIGGFVAQLEHVVALRIGGCKRQKRITQRDLEQRVCLDLRLLLSLSLFLQLCRQGGHRETQRVGLVHHGLVRIYA